MKLHNTLSKLSSSLLIGVATIATVACNEKTNDVEEYLTPYNVAVTSFTLNANTDVMANLDSVFFSIDLDNAVIFNADSLPVGTKIDKLIATIKYSSYVTKAELKIEGGETLKDTTINYLTNPTDSIDFTGKVTLSLTTESELTRDYLIKVNVHKEKSDSLVWGDMAYASLPSRTGSPKNQKTIDFNGMAVSLIEESDGSYTFASSSDLYANQWSKRAISFPFTPNVRSLCATSDFLCILDNAGKMYRSSDGTSWSATGQTWHTIIGAYLDTAVGLKASAGGNGFEYAQYPQKNLVAANADSEFPISGSSNFVILANKWTSSPVGFFIGGTCSDGTLSNATWAFDGYNWIKLAQGGISAVKGASIIPYYGFRYTSSTWVQTEFPVWMAIGGVTADGSFNRTVYISYDNGVNWGVGSEMLQLPDEIPTMTDCDNVVMITRKDALISDAWTKTKSTRSHNVEVNGDVISWDCPYIYLFGGYDTDYDLRDTIWRGVLARLTFTPII